MDNNQYIKINNTGASGSLGIPDMQTPWGTQFVPTGRFSVQGNREFDTYVNAIAYIHTSVSAFPGIIITISKDGSYNGAYLVENDVVTSSNVNGLKMTKLSQSGDPLQEEIKWEIMAD